jgi:hypothetical protein
MINEGKIDATDIRFVGRRTSMERLAVGNGAASAGCLNVATAGTPAPLRSCAVLHVPWRDPRNGMWSPPSGRGTNGPWDARRKA